MKKKILLVLLVVLMVGILAFSVFACNDKKKEPSKTPVTNTPEEPEEPDDTDYFSLMIDDVIAAIDNTVANVNDIDTAASVNAEIYVDVVVGEESYNVKLNVAGSIDKDAASKNWALVEADILGVKVSLFAVNNGEVEDLYVAQNILNEDVVWSKLSQFEEANVLSGLACDSIIKLVSELDDTTVDKIENGLITSLAGDILGFMPIISSIGLFAPVEGGANDFTTADGYATSLKLSAISDLLASPMIASVIAGLPADYHGIIGTAVGLLLGGNLEFTDGGASYTPGSAEETPEISLAFGVKDELFTGLTLSYVLPELSVEFGIKNLSLSGASKAASMPFTGAPEELAIALNLDLTAQGITADTMTAQVNIYPNVAMTFKNDYVDFDFSKLYAVATANIAGENYTIAEYNVDGQEDLIIDLSSIANVTGTEVPATLFKVPVNIQEKFDKAMDDTKLNDQAKGYVAKVNEIDADEDLKDDEKAEMKKKAYDAAVSFIIENTVYVTAGISDANEIKAAATAALDGAIAAITGEAQNAIEGNVVDHVVDNILPTLFDAEGNFQIGALLGVVGQLGDIVDAISPILATEGLFSYELGEDEATANATLNLEVLMDALLVEDGIIDGITGEWNSFNLHFYQPEVSHSEYDEELDDWVTIVDVEESYEVKEMTLAQILAPNAVIDNIIAFVNSAMYDSYLDSFVPATEGEEALGYVDYFASEDAPVEFTKAMLTQAIAGLTGATLDAEDAYTNMTVSVNGYAQDGIGFGLEATLGEEVKTLGFGLGLSIIENVAVEDYTQKIFFEEKKGYDMAYEGEGWDAHPVYTEAYSNDTGKDGGRLLAYTAFEIASAIVNFLPNYVDSVAGEYGVTMEGAVPELAYNLVVENNALTINVEEGASWYKFEIAADATITLGVANDTAIKQATYGENGFFGISPAMPLVGTNAGYNEATYDYDLAIYSGSFSAVAGEVYIYVESNGAAVLNVTIA